MKGAMKGGMKQVGMAPRPPKPATKPKGGKGGGKKPC
jgi:hypothetical protein